LPLFLRSVFGQVTTRKQQMRTIDTIIVHCSATPPSMLDLDATIIRSWHIAKGWSDIGYHYVIDRFGTLENGRALSQTGAHARGYNATSVGICLVGGIDENDKPEANFTAKQYQTLCELVDELQTEFNIVTENIIGHNQVSAKACPCFNVPEFFR